jgi:hypothetical protein
VVSGSLPTGLTICPNGELVGTPTAAGVSTFTLSANNGYGTPATQSNTITVAPGGAADISVAGGDAQAATVGQPFPIALSARVVDAYGNPIPSASVTFAVTSGSATFPGVVSGTRSSTWIATTDTSGVATASTLTADGTVGPVTVTAALTGTTTVPVATFTETVLSTSASRADIKVAITAPTSVARGASFKITVTVTNAGPNAATALLTGLDLGKGLTVTNANGGTLGSGAGSVYWKATRLNSGASLTYTITVKAANSKSAYSSGVVAASLSEVADPKPSNNLTTAALKVT